jgi:magnesium-transporting ATPase (P-type)
MLLVDRFDLDVDPVSMVVEGSAFAELYPSPLEAKKKKEEEESKKNKKKDVSVTKNEKRRQLSQIPKREQSHFNEERLAQLRTDFFDLAAKMKSVICCRLTPFQKAKIVQEIKARQKVITLAIGDGANDEAMILEADVGVGITGLEGTAAARASAYSIGQFRFLHTLLFVHGNWCYRRIAELVLYIFYKAVMIVIVMFWFGFFIGFSGQQLINDWIFSYYNVLFTAAPVMVLAIVDRSLERKTLENTPLAYASILDAFYFDKNM